MKYTIMPFVEAGEFQNLVEAIRRNGSRVSNVVSGKSFQSAVVHGEIMEQVISGDIPRSHVLNEYSFRKEPIPVDTEEVSEMTNDKIVSSVKKAIDKTKQLHVQGKEVEAVKLAKQSGRVLAKMNQRSASKVQEDAVINPDVVTSHYIMSHGKNPGGRGHWIFGIGSRDSKDHFTVNDNYAEARKKAIEVAKKQGASRVFVMESYETSHVMVESVVEQKDRMFVSSVIVEGKQRAETTFLNEKAAKAKVGEWTGEIVLDAIKNSKDLDKTLTVNKLTPEQKAAKEELMRTIKQKVKDFRDKYGVDAEVADAMVGGLQEGLVDDIKKAATPTNIAAAAIGGLAGAVKGYADRSGMGNVGAGAVQAGALGVAAKAASQQEKNLRFKKMQALNRWKDLEDELLAFRQEYFNSTAKVLKSPEEAAAMMTRFLGQKPGAVEALVGKLKLPSVPNSPAWLKAPQKQDEGDQYLARLDNLNAKALMAEFGKFYQSLEQDAKDKLNASPNLLQALSDAMKTKIDPDKSFKKTIVQIANEQGIKRITSSDLTQGTP